MQTYESIGCFYVSNNDTIVMSLYGCIVFTILNITQNANLLFICSIKSNTRIIVSTMILIFISILSMICIWIIYHNNQILSINTDILLLIIVGVIFVLQIIIILVNKVFIVNYPDIKQIYIYAIYSYEFLAMFIIYILIESTIADTLVNIVIMYIFVLCSMPAIQKHDQNNQDEQYFVMLSFLMLLPTLVVIAAPSIHIFYINPM